MVSVIQNFICTDKKRLEVMLDNLPVLGKAFQDYQFYVNFNDTVNLDIVQKSYKKYIKKLNFYNNLERQWAEVTLAMLEEVDTEYIINLCEDQVVHFNSTDLKNVLNEVKELGIDYVNLTKINKYSKNTFLGYTERKYGYSYIGSDSPTGRLSTDCLVKVDFWKERFREFIQNKHNCPHRIPFPYENIPNYIEGYYDHSIGVRRFKNLKCYIPKQIMFVEYNDSLEKGTYS
jgi:hypothetical protein